MKVDEFDKMTPFQREVIVLLSKILKVLEGLDEEMGA